MAKRYYRRTKSSSDFSNIIIILVLIIGVMGFIAQAIPFNTDQLFPIVITVAMICMLMGLGIIFYFSQKEKKRKRAITLSHVDSMGGIEFEQYLGDLLNSQGYNVSYTPVTGDFGTDILAQKGGKKYSIQAKRYRDKVGPPAIQQAVTALKVYNCDQAIVITNSYYTKEAKELAKYNDCQLIDRDSLTDWILKFQKSKVKLIG